MVGSPKLQYEMALYTHPSTNPTIAYEQGDPATTTLNMIFSVIWHIMPLR